MEHHIPILKYCYNCGGLLVDEEASGRVRKVCPDCGTVNYRNPIPSVAVVITDDEGRLLLTKRSVEPGRGLWCLPGGFIEMGEDAEETVVREVAEETGLQVVSGKFLGPCSKIGGYHGDVIILGFTAEVKSGILTPGDDAEEAEYYPLNALPEIAFRCHAYFIEEHFGLKSEGLI